MQVNSILKQPIAVVALFLLTSLLSVSCSKQKTEAEQYEELRDSFKYKTYLSISRTGIPAVVKLYNEKHPGNTPADEYTAHLFLSLAWIASNKPDFAIAESHLAEEKTTESHEKFVASAARAIGMHEKGWRQLAGMEVENGKNHFKTFEEKKHATETLIAAYAILGIFSLYEKDLDQALIAFRGLDTLTGISIPSHLTLALKHLERADVKSAKEELLLAANDPVMPEGARAEINSFIAKVETEYGSMDSSLFIPRLVSKIAWQQLKASTKSGISDLSKTLDEYIQTIK